MKYVSASEVLPDDLLIEVQKYIQGSILYIPSPQGSHKSWGQISGQKEMLSKRNKEIKDLYKLGVRIDQIADTFCLAEETVKKIIYKKA